MGYDDRRPQRPDGVTATLFPHGYPHPVCSLTASVVIRSIYPSFAPTEVTHVTVETSTYGADQIQVLEGLEAVRKRPGMYIGSTGPSGLHHLVYEVVDNSVDEAMAGYADHIEVTLGADGCCQVVDNGRGIPTDPHPKYPGMSAAEVAITVLHAGGKFGGGGYKVSGGLHGVGISVVNALSARTEVDIDRGGERWSMSYRDGGTPDQPLRQVGPTPASTDGIDRPSGTTVRFWPDPTIFDDVTFRSQTLMERLQMMAFLNAGLTISFSDERGDEPEHTVFCYENGWRSRSNGTRATTPTACTALPTASTRSKAACTRRASRRPSPTRSTVTRARRVT